MSDDGYGGGGGGDDYDYESGPGCVKNFQFLQYHIKHIYKPQI